MNAPMARAANELIKRLRSSVRCSKKVMAPPGSSSGTATAVGVGSAIAAWDPTMAVPGTVSDTGTAVTSMASSGGLLGVMGGVVAASIGGAAVGLGLVGGACERFGAIGGAGGIDSGIGGGLAGNRFQNWSYYQIGGRCV